MMSLEFTTVTGTAKPHSYVYWFDNRGVIGYMELYLAGSTFTIPTADTLNSISSSSQWNYFTTANLYIESKMCIYM